ncbi:MAG: spore coat protein U domain-containing protein [Nevskia sp.]|nr:spore coat protein U domain-containing protein [Nevskia sp.]
MFLAAGLAASAGAWGQTCDVSSPTLAFGVYSPLAVTPSRVSTTVTVTCRATLALLISYRILLSAGNSGNVQDRWMASGTNRLRYNLYTDPSYSTVWDNTNGVTGTILLTLLLLNGSDTKIIYGNIPAQQFVPAATYTDSLLITISY